jgi:hypothetical protein
MEVAARGRSPAPRMAPSGALVRPLAGAPRLPFILAFGLASFVVIVGFLWG